MAGDVMAGRVLLCEEDSPGIHAFDLSRGQRLVSLAVPEIFRSRRPNRGFESLAIDAEGRHVWTANEEPLAVDGPAVSAEAAGVVRLARVPIARPDPSQAPLVLQHAYPVDPPHRFVRVLEGAVFSGVTAIVCGSDLMALGAIRTIRQRGLSVPEDVSVVGYDDSRLIAFTDPPLTTVRQAVTAMGTAAVQALLDGINGTPAPRDEFVFRPELVVRSSTGPVPGTGG